MVAPEPEPEPEPLHEVAVVPLRVEGLQLNDVTRLNDALRAQVARVSPHALQPEARTTELYEAAKALGLACDINEVECALQLGRLLEVPFVVLGRASVVEGAEAGVDLRLIDVTAGLEARRAVMLIPLGDGAPPDVRALAEALFSARPLTRDAIVSLRPSEGASLFVDGMPVPVTTSGSLQKLVGLVPGPHVVRAVADGYHPITRRFDATADAVSAIELTLEPLPEITVEREISPLEVALPWTLAGSGVVVAVAGAITAGFGIQPWLAYGALYDKHQALDPNTEGYPARVKESWDDVDAQVKQWEAWGRPAFVTGLSLGAVGVVACAAGTAWGALLLLRDPGEVLEQE